ncbi:MAG: hypothetical protein IKP47_03605 [Ruminococcus sp.]|nr:hypothetical protein [Ruminococcus sp.]
MNFTSITFLYFFLPAFFLIYAVTKPAYRAYIMLIGSCTVICWGSPYGLVPLAISVLISYLCSLCIDSLRDRKKLSVLLLIVSLLTNLAAVVLFCSLPTVRSRLFTAIGAGIYALHSAAYTFDVYRNECEAVRSPLRLAAYISFLPSLCGIPLVKPKETIGQMKETSVRSDMLTDGILLLLFGIAAKVIVGDRLYTLFQELEASAKGDLSMLMSWLGAFIFGFSVFARLKGYACIAQGFGMMLGFRIGPSFDYPYSKTTLREYLASYNISAYSFVQRYVFRPIAGSETNQARTLTASAVSLVVICASYRPSASFLIWGAGAALFISLEIILDSRLSHVPRPVRFIMTHMLTVIGWAVISQKTAVSSLEYVAHMLTGALTLDTTPLLYYFRSAAPLFVLILLFESKSLRNAVAKLEERSVSPITVIKPVLILTLLVMVTVFLMSGSVQSGIL